IPAQSGKPVVSVLSTSPPPPTPKPLRRHAATGLTSACTSRTGQTTTHLCATKAARGSCARARKSEAGSAASLLLETESDGNCARKRGDKKGSLSTFGKRVGENGAYCIEKASVWRKTRAQDQGGPEHEPKSGRDKTAQPLPESPLAVTQLGLD
ncbi:hypothetical protein Z043_111302, partial [Scleropages formosus]